jgi:hypothetical protein
MGARRRPARSRATLYPQWRIAIFNFSLSGRVKKRWLARIRWSSDPSALVSSGRPRPVGKAAQLPSWTKLRQQLL